jgi:hypothetical protein
MSNFKESLAVSHPSDGYIDDPDVVDPPIETTQTDSGQGSDDEFLPEIVESEYAYDRATLYSLRSRDIYDALRFESELKDTFGFAWVDSEVRRPLQEALQLGCDLIEEGAATPHGILAMVLKKFMTGHLRGFGRYCSGKDPWPRPSAVVKAEIVRGLPFALNWLRQELRESLAHERYLGSKGPESQFPPLTEDEIQRAELGDLHKAWEFQTEFLQTFDLHRTDDWLDEGLVPALQAYIESAESGKFSPEGSFVMAVRTLLRKHSAFKTYVPGPEAPWPRPSTVVQAEIDSRMPNALYCLQFELDCALEEERLHSATSGKNP